MMKKNWIINNTVSESEIESFISKVKTDRITAKLLLQRNLKEKDQVFDFFKPDLNKLHDPFLMKDMENAVNRLIKAYDNNEKVMLYGDYDVDGTTSVALLFRNLSDHIDLIYYIPDRFDEGYGISNVGIDHAKRNNIDLIISLDCGIKSKDEISYAKNKNIDFIVCDHHEVDDCPPKCIILNPKQKDCKYPFDGLSGCGVGFKFLEAFYKKIKWNNKKLFIDLELVAISIGADMVPLVDENRILAFHGLLKLNSLPSPPIKSLIQVSNKKFPLNIQDVVFAIAPKINAVGRLRNGTFAVDFLTSKNQNEINSILQDIQKDNNERKELDQNILNDALNKIANNKKFSSFNCTILYDQNWHKGVLGIVASRLIEKYYQPTIILNEENRILSGSARSIEGINIHDAITSCSKILLQFGGHANAAGVRLKKENFESFVKHIDEYIKKQMNNKPLMPSLKINSEINFNDIFKSNENRSKIPRFKEIIDHFEPTGQKNLKPLFVSKNLFSVETKVLQNKHLKMKLVQEGSDIKIEAIAFNMIEKEHLVAAGLSFSAVYTIETNRFMNRNTIQLVIKDLK